MQKKIRVAQFICSTGFYGAERWILALAKYMDRQNFCCDLVVTAEAENKDLELVNEFKRQCSDIGVVHLLPMQSRFDLTAVKRLAQVIIDNKIDILHTHGYKSDILGILAAKKAKIPVVVTPHGFENSTDKKLQFFIWLGGNAMRFANVVAPLSTQLVKDSIAYGVPQDKIKYIQNGVDLSEVEAIRDTQNSAAPKQTGIKRIGFVGQLISRKNVKDILDIFDSLVAERNDLELVLLGDGDARAELENYASTLASNSKIQFLGFRDDRLALLKSFDLFVMTSTLEGIPRCLMEALAMGIPVAAYDIPGIDQLIKHGQTGLLAALYDKKTLKSHWEKILSDPEFALGLSRNGINFVEQNYAGARMAREYQTLFMELIHGS